MARSDEPSWTATAVGPTLGGAAISLLGPAVTVIANAVGFLLSALGIGAIRQKEAVAERAPSEKFRAADLVQRWRFIHEDRGAAPRRRSRRRRSPRR